jgi:hypothetical protein
METSCQRFRERGDETGDDLARHAADCGECRAWMRARERQVEALRSLARLAAPPELETRIHGGSSSESPRPSAAEPSAQRELEEAAARPGVAAVQGLHRLNAPTVLLRLVSEELVDPERARLRRFAGDLERARAPHELEHRLAAELEPRRTRRLTWVPLATLAAAGLLVWLGPFRGAVGPGSTRDLEIVRVDAGDPRLSPLARDLASAWSGGFAWTGGLDGVQGPRDAR